MVYFLGYHRYGRGLLDDFGFFFFAFFIDLFVSSRWQVVQEYVSFVGFIVAVLIPYSFSK